MYNTSYIEKKIQDLQDIVDAQDEKQSISNDRLNDFKQELDGLKKELDAEKNYKDE